MPLGLPENLPLMHAGRRLLLVRTVGWQLDIVDAAGEPFLVPLAGVDRLVRPDVDWLLAEARSGVLYDAEQPLRPLGDRRAEFLGLDREACRARDQKSAWRHDWALAALRADIVRSETAANAFIAELKPTPNGGPRPKWRSLLRWMATLDQDPHRRIGNLVAIAGRQAGQSQLPAAVDLLVHAQVGRFWSPQGDPFKLDVAARVVAGWDALKAAGREDVGDAPPSAECVRERVNALQNRTTFTARHGEHAARRYYAAKGEPIASDAPLGRVTIDGVVHRHVCTFSDDWDLPAAKMKSIFAMCGGSQFAFPGPTFSGPFRPEATVQALLGLLTPPRLTAEQLAQDPRRGECFGPPGVLHPDNEKALLPPAMIPNLVTIVPVVELPKAYHSDAKAKHERFHRFLKGCLHRLKGRVLGPSTLSDPRHDPLASADVTRQQFAAMVELVRIAWNERPKKSLGWRSPTDVLVEQLMRTGRRSLPPEQIERNLSRTVSVVLTTNGVEFDGVRYRFNERGVEKALDGNVRRQPFAKRLADTGRCELTARVWDSDLDYIDVYDPEIRDYHRLYSTDPDYTAGLTRYEHHEYLRMQAGRPGAKPADRLRRRHELLRQIEDELPDLPFRARAAGVAVLEQEETRRASGHLGRTAAYDSLIVPDIPIEAAGADRLDEPAPPPQRATGGRRRRTRREGTKADPTYPVADRGAGIDEGDDEGRPASIWDDARRDDDED